MEVDILSRYTREFVMIYVALILITWLFNVFATLIDLWTGLDKAHAIGEPIKSNLLRRTINKIGDYWKVQAFALMIDTFGSLFWCYPFASMAAGLGIIAIEWKSVIENLKAKKAAAAQLPSVIAQIMSAKSKEDALKVLQTIQTDISTKAASPD